MLDLLYVVKVMQEEQVLQTVQVHLQVVEELVVEVVLVVLVVLLHKVDQVDQEKHLQ
tara:strand:- start:324 stop:494 length:171 start_codon:yes stop_codon:yes gene_type:complete